MNSGKNMLNKFRAMLLVMCFLISGTITYAQVPAALANLVPQPRLYSGQRLVGLYYFYSAIKRGTTKSVMATIDKSNTATKKDVVLQAKNNTDARQLWYVIQDDEYRGFSLVNAGDGSWLEISQSTDPSTNVVTTSLAANTNPVTEEIAGITKPQKTAYYFEDVPTGYITESMAYPNGPPVAMLQFRRLKTSIADNDADLPYLSAGDINPGTWYLEAQDQAYRAAHPLVSSGKTFQTTFFIRESILSDVSSSWLPVPFESSNFHTASSFTANVTSSQVNYTAIAKTVETNPSPSHGIILSSLGFTFGRLNGDELCIDLSRATNSYVGLVSYEFANIAQAAFRSSDKQLPKPRFGIGTFNNKVYVMRGGLVDTLTGFAKNEPIFIGRWYEGTAYLQQRTGSQPQLEYYYDVPINCIWSRAGGASTRILAKTGKDDTLFVSYKPRNVVFVPSEYGTRVPEETSTNPDFPYVKSANDSINHFDWRSDRWKLRYKVNGTDINEEVLSPFFTTQTNLTSISARYNNNSKHKGFEDNDPYSGLELIKADLGYYNDGRERESVYLRAQPYVVMYDRMLGKLRVIVYIKNDAISNSYKVTLSPINMPKSNTSPGKYKPPFLWNAWLQGYPLDDSRNAATNYTEVLPFYTSSTGKFYYADFQLFYDPCVAFFESAIQISFSRVTTSSTMELVGRSEGGTVTTGAGVKNWYEENPHFLLGAYNNDIDATKQQLGDITFKKSLGWGLKEFANEPAFTLPGKKVEQWERDAAKLDYDAAVVSAASSTVNAFGELADAVGEIGGSAKWVNPVKIAGAIAKTIGAFGSASSEGMQAQAAKLRWENLADEPDKEIKLPEPTPSIVFSELALRGQFTIATSDIEDIKLTTPGSLNANQAPTYHLNGTKGSRALYNEPLGLFNVITPPTVDLLWNRESQQVYRYQSSTSTLEDRPYVIDDNDSSGGVISKFGMAMHLSQKPVFAYNPRGFSRPTFSVKFRLEVYKTPEYSSGKPSYQSNYAGYTAPAYAYAETPEYTMGNDLSNIPVGNQLPATIDLMPLLNQAVFTDRYEEYENPENAKYTNKYYSPDWILQDNIKALIMKISGKSIPAWDWGITNSRMVDSFRSWVKVKMIVTLIDPGKKVTNGAYQGNEISRTYELPCNYKFNNYRWEDNEYYNPSERQTGYKSDAVGFGKLVSATKANVCNTCSSSPEAFSKSDPAFPDRMVVTPLDEDFASKMKDFCENHQTGTISNAFIAYKKAQNDSASEHPVIGKEGFVLYPNPTSGSCRLDYIVKMPGTIHISLNDMTGRQLIDHRDNGTEKGDTKSATIDVSGLPPGMYTVVVRFSDGSSYTGKLAKR